MNYQIAVDGPAGAGKSTIAKLAAKELGFVYIDTGAMYRAMGLFFDRNGEWPRTEEEIAALAAQAEITLENRDGVQEIFLNGENVSQAIRTESAGMSASAVSRFPAVRRVLVAQQQKMAQRMNVIMDGRDIGTVVLPQAQLKIYLTADAHVRAERRLQQLREKGEDGDLAEIEADILRRDHQDMTREASPLKQAEDAVLLDTSHMSIPEVVDAILALQKERGGK